MLFCIITVFGVCLFKGYDHFMLRQLYDCCFTVCVIVTLETKFSRVDLFFNACKQRVVKLWFSCCLILEFNLLKVFLSEIFTVQSTRFSLDNIRKSVGNVYPQEDRLQGTPPSEWTLTRRCRCFLSAFLWLLSSWGAVVIFWISWGLQAKLLNHHTHIELYNIIAGQHFTLFFILFFCC